MSKPLITGRLKEICKKRWGNPNFKKLQEEFYPEAKFIIMEEKKESKYKWRLATGFLYPVDMMSKKHITNTINCISGKTKTNPIPDEHFKLCVPDNLDRNSWINVFLEELNYRIKK